MKANSLRCSEPNSTNACYWLHVSLQLQRTRVLFISVSSQPLLSHQPYARPPEQK
jgi:hypothetical protein